VQGVTGVSNRRIKGDILETAPSLPPLKLSREGSFSSFTAHHHRRSPFRRTFFSAAVPAIPCTALPIYNLGAWETSRVTAGFLKFNA
jgi:hypothetical protein